MPANHLPDSERTAIGKLGAHIKWTNTLDRTKATDRARAGHLAKFVRRAREKGLTDDAEIAKFVESSQAAHMAAMTAKSLKVRRQRRAAQLRDEAQRLEQLADGDDGSLGDASGPDGTADADIASPPPREDCTADPNAAGAAQAGDDDDDD